MKKTIILLVLLGLSLNVHSTSCYYLQLGLDNQTSVNKETGIVKYGASSLYTYLESQYPGSNQVKFAIHKTYGTTDIRHIYYLNCTNTNPVSCTWYDGGTYSYDTNWAYPEFNLSSNTGIYRLDTQGVIIETDMDYCFINNINVDYNFRNFTAGYLYSGFPIIDRFPFNSIVHYEKNGFDILTDYSTEEFRYGSLRTDCDAATEDTYLTITNMNLSDAENVQSPYQYYSIESPPYSIIMYSPEIVTTLYYEANQTIDLSMLENNVYQTTGIGWYRSDVDSGESSFVDAESKNRSVSISFSAPGTYWVIGQFESVPCGNYLSARWNLVVLTENESIPTTTTSTTTSTTTTIVSGGTILNMIYPSSNNSVTPCDFTASFYGGILGAEYIFETYTNPSYGYSIDYPLTGYGNYYMDVNNIENGSSYTITAIIQQYPLLTEIASKTWSFTAECGVIGPTTTTVSITTTTTTITTTTTLPGCFVIGVGTSCQGSCANQYNGGNCTIVGAINCINNCPVNNETTVTTFTYPTVTYDKITELPVSVNETDCSNYTKMTREGDYAGQAMCAYSSGIGTPWVIGFLLLFVCGSAYKATKNYSAALVTGLLVMAATIEFLPLVYRIFAGAIVALLLTLGIFTRLIDKYTDGGKEIGWRERQ